MAMLHYIYYCYVFVVLVLCINVTLGGTIPPSDPNIQYRGRISTDQNAPYYTFEWSAMRIFVAVNSSNISVYIQESGPYTYGNMYDVFIDGRYTLWLNTTTSTELVKYDLVEGLPEGVHLVEIFKRTEAFFGPVIFAGFEVDDGATTFSLPLPKRRIEFIGDSITCAFGVLGAYPCNFSITTENSFYSYASIVSSFFGADLRVESWSGRGMVRNYADPNITSAYPLPALYEYALPTALQSPWDPTTWVPQTIVINLGTNDYSTTPFPPQELYQDAYIAFIARLTKMYQPTPKFFLVCGPMQNSKTCPYVQNVAKKTQSIYIDLTNALVFPQDYGCASHPSVVGQEKMASHLIVAIHSMLGW